MSLERNGVLGIPDETARVARRMMRRPTLAMRFRDLLGVVWTDELFAEAFPSAGRPAASPGALALVSVLQRVENLTDRAAAEAVRARIDWRYALGLELDDPGFDASVLSQFRARVIEHGLEDRVLSAVLTAADEAGLLDKRSSVRTDSTKVLAKVTDLNRLELVGQTLQAALEAAGRADGEWLAGWLSEEQFERYALPVNNWRLPKSDSDRQRWVQQVGSDGFAFLAAVAEPGREALAGLPAVALLARVWDQQFASDGDRVRLRSKPAGPGAEVIESPFDPEARYSVKNNRTWIGYKAHFAETCGDNHPHLVVAALTTAATAPDVTCTEPIARALSERGIEPDTHYVDQGYTSGALIADAADAGVDLCGPVPPDRGANARAGTFTNTDFIVDEQARQVTCPAGQVTDQWRDRTEANGTASADIRFPAATCHRCPLRSDCTVTELEKYRTGRTLRIMLGAPQQALRKRRAEQQSPAWRKRYGKRAGIEGTIAQATGRIGLRMTPYRGKRKTRLHHQLGAAAMNLLRIDAWQCGNRPEPTRTTYLTRLYLEHHA